MWSFNHHAFAAHFCGAAWLASLMTQYLLEDYPALSVFWVVVLAAFALGALVELSQLVLGWGQHTLSDMLITTAGGAAGFLTMFAVMSL